MHPVNLTIGAPAGFMNANHRPHWAARARDTRAWREAAWAHARSENLAPRDRRARVTVVFHHADRRRRDVGNLAPTAKAIVDGRGRSVGARRRRRSGRRRRRSSRVGEPPYRR